MVSDTEILVSTASIMNLIACEEAHCLSQHWPFHLINDVATILLVHLFTRVVLYREDYTVLDKGRRRCLTLAFTRLALAADWHDVRGISG